MPAGYPAPAGSLPRPPPANNLDIDDLVRVLGHSTTAKSYDPDGDNALAEFAATKTVNTTALKRLKKLFKNIDIDGNGTVQLPEFRKLILQCDPAELGLPEVQLADIFDVADSDGDGDVNYKEFVAWLGLSGSDADAEDEVMPEVKKRSTLGGPTRSSVGSVCWQELDDTAVMGLAKLLQVQRMQNLDLDKSLAKCRGEIQEFRLALGAMESELLQRRLRARGAMRKWVAENYAVSTKNYMKQVEQIEIRDKQKAAQRKAIENDPEAAEFAHLSSWTLTQKLNQLSKEHCKTISLLEKKTAEERDMLKRLVPGVAASIGNAIFPADSLQTVGQLRVDEACQDAECIVRTSVDAVYVPGEDVVVCVDIHVKDLPVAEQPSKRRLGGKATDDTPEKLSRPVDFILVIDQSDSMAEDIPHVCRSLCDFIDNMDVKDRLSVITFADSAELLLDWTDMVTDNRPAARACAEKLSAKGKGCFLPAGKMFVQQLENLEKLDKVAKPAGPREKVILFIADGPPAEARDAVFSSFTHSLAPFNGEVSFAALALGPGADAVLMSEICHATQGAMYYTTDENTLDEVIGEVWATARSPAVKNTYIALRPLPGCAVAEVEDFGGVCKMGPKKRVEEIKLTNEQLVKHFRCVVRFNSEAEADKACQFDGGSSAPVYLAADLREGELGSGVAGVDGKGAVLAKKGLRLLCIRRSKFLAKPAAKKSPLIYLATETTAANGQSDFGARPIKSLLTKAVSRGPIELEFEATYWCDGKYELSEDVALDEVTIFKGSTLIGYKLGASGSMATEELAWPSAGGNRGTIIAGLEQIATLAGTKAIILIFDLCCCYDVIKLGNLQHGASRQLSARLRVPQSLLSSSRLRGPDLEAIMSRPLLDVVVGGRLVSGSSSRQIQHRVGLTVAQVPSIFAQKTSVPRMVLRMPFVSPIGVSGEEIATSFVGAAKLHEQQLVPNGVKQQSETIVDVQLQLAVNKGFSDINEAAQSNDTFHAMEERGLAMIEPPQTVGSKAFRRFCQWRLAQALRIAAVGSSSDNGCLDALYSVRQLCLTELGQALDPVQQEKDGHLNCISAEAAASIASFQASECWRHRLLGLAHAHARQIPLLTALGALEIFATRQVWKLSVAPSVLEHHAACTARARVRDQEPECVPALELLGAEMDSISVRFRAVSGNGQPVSAYNVRARDFKTGEVHQRSVKKEGGEFDVDAVYQVSLDKMASDRLFLVTVHAWNGRKGPASDPVWCRTKSGLSATEAGTGKRSTAFCR